MVSHSMDAQVKSGNVLMNAAQIANEVEEAERPKSSGATGPEFFLMRAGEELMDMIPSREVSLAKTKVDEAVMWLERARRNQAPPSTPALTADDV
jgi:hypothetical protein